MGNEKKLNVRYGPFKRNRMDVYLPTVRNSETPFVILIHGGAWVMGSKRMYRGMQKTLLKNGIASANLNYRLIGSKANYLDMLEDIGNAIKTCNKMAANWNPNLQQYHIMGESAGAHLALLYGNQNSEEVKSILSFSGPVNFGDAKRLDQMGSLLELPLLEKLAGAIYIQGSENVPFQFKDMSPINHINHVKTFLFQGGKDKLVDAGLVQEYVAELKEKGVDYQFVFKPNWGHVYRIWPNKRKLIQELTINWIKNQHATDSLIH